MDLRFPTESIEFAYPRVSNGHHCAETDSFLFLNFYLSSFEPRGRLKDREVSLESEVKF